MGGSYNKGRFAKPSAAFVSVHPLHWCFPIPSLQDKETQMNGKRTFEMTVHTDQDISGWEALGRSDSTRMKLLSCVSRGQPSASHPENAPNPHNQTSLSD